MQNIEAFCPYKSAGKVKVYLIDRTSSQDEDDRMIGKLMNTCSGCIDEEGSRGPRDVVLQPAIIPTVIKCRPVA